MSQNRKMLKIFSLIQVPIALAALVMGALTLAGSSAAGGNASVLGIELAASPAACLRSAPRPSGSAARTDRALSAATCPSPS